MRLEVENGTLQNEDLSFAKILDFSNSNMGKNTITKIVSKKSDFGTQTKMAVSTLSHVFLQGVPTKK